MKPTFTHLEITRLAYNEASHETSTQNSTEREYRLLKKMQQKVDACLAQPSQDSVNKILAAMRSL
jgi:hypothetical protein